MFFCIPCKVAYESLLEVRYYEALYSSVPKILADELQELNGVFLFHTMRQTHPWLTGTIQEKN